MTGQGLPGSLTWSLPAPGELGGGAPRPWALHHSEAPDSSGPAPSCWVPVGKLTLAKKNQEEAQMTHCPTFSKVKTQQCVWPSGLHITDALASPTAKIKALSQQHTRSPGTRAMGLFRCPVPHTFFALKSFKLPSIEHDGFHFQKESTISF